MDAVKFLKVANRICKSLKGEKCSECPLNHARNGHEMTCDSLRKELPDKFIEIVEKWNKEHPVKTFLSDFKEKYPNAMRGREDIPDICPIHLGYIYKCSNSNKSVKCQNDCVTCWNTPLEDTDE